VIEFKPQLALHKYKADEKKKKDHLGKPYLMFEKHDGWYGHMYLGEEPAILSRANRVIPSVQHIADLLDAAAKQHGLRGRLIFEIMVEGVTEFKDLNGILNRTKGDFKAENAYLLVHDFIPEQGKNMSGWQRWCLANEVCKRVSLDVVRKANFLGSTNNLQEGFAEVIAQRIWDVGGEGIILKRADTTYKEGTRVSELMKIKLETTVDLLVISLVRGEGKYANTLGALRCVDSKGTVHTLSGMSDKERDLWWETPSLIVNKVVEGQAMCWLPNGSLREPRYKSIRFDKTIADID
jgi:ATP-dependent DNA ligase